MNAVWSLRHTCQKTRFRIAGDMTRGIAVYSLRMLLERLHRLPAPPNQSEVPHLQRPLQHRYGEETRVIKVVRLLVLVGRRERGILRLVESADASAGSTPLHVFQASTADADAPPRADSPLRYLSEVELGVRVLLEEVVPAAYQR
jgi:hypothetical protein